MVARRSQVNVAEAKKSFSDLIGRVAYGRESVTILKRGRPMARLVPVTKRTRSPLSKAKGWLDKMDPFFKVMEEILSARHTHQPRRSPTLKG